MEKRSLARLCAFIGASPCPAVPAGAEISDICTDTRRLSRGCLFVALRGERFDGHDYIPAALENGAAAALSEVEYPGLPVVVVENTRKALLQLAAGYRREFSPVVCGVTGSVGKTTVKEMTAAVFSQKWNTLKTEGNLNNDIGLPLTLFRLGREHRAAVLEMGMSARGEISVLTRAAAPDIAIINNIGTAHIEHLGSREGICEAKLEIAEGLGPEGVLILNGDEPLLWRLRGHLPHKTLYFGIDNPEADIRAQDIIASATGSVCTVAVKTPFALDIPAAGRHNVYNALAAAAAGLTAGLSPTEIAAGIKGFQNTGMRQRVFESGGMTLVDDCYNANPDSMRAALSVLEGLPVRGRRIAVLGSMFELGAYAAAAHREVGITTAKTADLAIFCGPNAEDFAEGAREGGMDKDAIWTEKDADGAGRRVAGIAREGDALLFKGSRGMRMEHALAVLTGREKA